MNLTPAEGNATRPPGSSGCSANCDLLPASVKALPTYIAWLQRCFGQCEPDSWAAMLASTLQPGQDSHAEPHEESCNGAAALSHPQQPTWSPCLQADPPVSFQAQAHADTELPPEQPARVRSKLPPAGSRVASVLDVQESQPEAVAAWQPAVMTVRKPLLELQTQGSRAPSCLPSAHSTEAGQSPLKKQTWSNSKKAGPASAASMSPARQPEPRQQLAHHESAAHHARCAAEVSAEQASAAPEHHETSHEPCAAASSGLQPEPIQQNAIGPAAELLDAYLEGTTAGLYLTPTLPVAAQYHTLGWIPNCLSKCSLLSACCCHPLSQLAVYWRHSAAIGVS